MGCTVLFQTLTLIILGILVKNGFNVYLSFYQIENICFKKFLLLPMYLRIEALGNIVSDKNADVLCGMYN